LSKDLGVFSFCSFDFRLVIFQEFSNMFYAEQRRERYVSVFDVAAFVAVRAARYFREAARRSKQSRAVEVAKRPQKDARKPLRAQAPPRASEVRMREDVEALRVQRLL
jgi:hypothetical protein